MKVLDNVTLICVDCKNIGEAISALRESLKQIKPNKALFLTDVEVSLEDIEVVNIPKIKSKREYSEFIIKQLYKYFETDYVMIVQADGFILDHTAWSDDFLNFDCLGAPWNFDHDRLIGNGGASLRTKKLQTILGTDDFIDVLHPCDQSIGIVYKFYLEEKYGIKFPPVELAERFSFELREPVRPTFAFHGTHWEPYKEHIMITRRDSLGDVIAVEPVLHYYHQKGYNVILNTLPQFQNLFNQHYYPIKLPHEVNPKIKFREVNLNLAYEAFPEMNHLDAYYQACGIPKEERIMRNPILTLEFIPRLPENKLYEKYICIHSDIRQAERNISGLDWDKIAEYFLIKGYTVIHIGRGESEPIKGAVKMNTPTEPFLKWVLGGADLFLGIDSGPANIAVAMQTPAIIFTGSVDLRKIYPDLSNILWLHNHEKDICENKYCWHSRPGTQGVPCYIDRSAPPCTKFDTLDVLKKIEKFAFS
jgi:ADP-heptose:LPS heptosyltransferase